MSCIDDKAALFRDSTAFLLMKEGMIKGILKKRLLVSVPAEPLHSAGYPFFAVEKVQK